MRTLQIFGILLTISILGSCKKKPIDEFNNYVFIKSYCATVTVGGVVGISEKCFNLGDTVKGKKIADGAIRIRIAIHSDVNDLPANPNSFQEFLDVPSGNLRQIKKLRK